MSFLEQVYSHPKNCFSANHFLIGFDKCDRLHGHNYHVTVHLQYNHPDLNIPIDFRIVNTAIRQELNLLNQKILLPKESPKIQVSSSLKGKNWLITVENKEYSFPKKDVVFLDGITQATVEYLAFYIHQKIKTWLKTTYPNIVKTLKVTISESLGNQVCYSAPV